MKKLIAIVTSILMCACLCTQVAAVELSAAQSKLSLELRETFSQIGSSETVTTYVAMQDVDHDAVMAEFARRYPEEHAAYVAAKTGSAIQLGTASANEELLQRALELKRAVYRDFYLAQNQTVISEYVQTRSQLFVSAYSPVAILELDRGTALAIARRDDVLSISELTEIDCAAIGPESLNILDNSELIENLDISNQITRADILRDTKNLTGSGVKIGIIEAEGVPDTTNPYLHDALITIRPGDEVASMHATIDALILAAKSTDGTMHGIVPEAHFYCAKWYNKVAPSITNIKYFYDDVEWMISCGVNIINASCSVFEQYGDEGVYEDVSKWVDHIATVHDIHFVAAAGNNDYPPESINVTPPAMAYNAITVGGFLPNGSDAIEGFTMLNPDTGDALYPYQEKGTIRPEKPNLVAGSYVGQHIKGGVLTEIHGTSQAAPQVTGVIAQLCCWDGNLKFRQSVVGAVLAASAAEKIDATVDNNQAYHFNTHIDGSEQISDVEGAGILDARWAWGILANHNYWHIVQNGVGIDGTNVFYEKTVTINTNVNNLTRIAIYWTKNNKNINHTNNSMGTNLELTNFNLYVYDSQGALIAYSETAYSNFEIVQFKPVPPGTYRIVIEIEEASNSPEYVGLAIW